MLVMTRNKGNPRATFSGKLPRFSVKYSCPDRGWLKRTNCVERLISQMPSVSGRPKSTTDREWVSPVACAALLALAALGGCSFAPKHVRPDPPVPASFDAQAPQPGSIARIGWRDFFEEPQLRQLIVEALKNNRDIRIAAGRVEEARAAFRIRGSALYPQLDGVFTGTRRRTPADLSFTGQAAERTQLYSQLSVGWQIDFWGRLRNLREAAREQYLATEEGRRGVSTSLVAQVAATYLFAQELDARIAIARDSVATRAESLRILRRRYEVGSGSNLEVTQAQTLLSAARTTLAALEQERGINSNALALLIGHPVELVPGTLRLAEETPRQDLPAGLPSELLESRPDIIAAEHRLRAAEADIGAARAAFFPNISLTGDLGTASAELGGLFKGGSSSWGFTPTLVLPIFNAGRNAAALDLAKARQSIAVAEYERTVQEAFRDVSDALVARRQLAEQIVATQEMLTALTERARLAQLRFDNGRSAYLEVLDAQRDLFSVRQSLIQLRSGYYASGIALYAALGGGFPADADQGQALTHTKETEQ